MNSLHKQRLALIICAMLLLGVAAGLMLYALRQNINLFYTPTQIKEGQAPAHKTFRVGGLVLKGSLKRSEQDLNVVFVISDLKNTMTVSYTGILPDLFREGQGIVARGAMSNTGQFVAEEVLAKHDENYMPPEVAEMLPIAHGKKS